MRSNWQSRKAAVRLQLGERLCRGMGAGGDHEVGHKAAEESKDEIKEALKGADMVFVTAGMGGRHRHRVGRVVAEIAKQSGALTIAIVTKHLLSRANIALLMPRPASTTWLVKPIR